MNVSYVTKRIHSFKYFLLIFFHNFYGGPQKRINVYLSCIPTTIAKEN